MVAGQTASNNDDVSGNHGGTDLWLVKLDANGNKVWTKCYGGSGNDYVGMVHGTSDGGFVLTGQSYSTDGDMPGTNGGADILVLKLDANGNKQWAKNFGGPSDESNGAIVVTSDGSIVLSANTSGNGGDVSGFHGIWDMWVVKLTSTGTKVWATAMGGSNDDEAFSLTPTSDGGFMVAGYTYSTEIDPTLNTGRDAWLVKLSAGGSQVWQKTFGGGGNTLAISEWVIPAADGGIVSGGALGSEAWLFEIK
jgi:hypothetical protein